MKYPDGSAARLLDGAGYHNLQPLTDTKEARSDLRGHVVLSKGPLLRFCSNVSGALVLSDAASQWLANKSFGRGFRAARPGVTADRCIFEWLRAAWEVG